MRRKLLFLVSALTAVGAALSVIPAAAQPSTATVAAPGRLTAVMDTSFGRITCQLFKEQAPLAVAHFVGLAEGTEEWTNLLTGQKTRTPLYNGTIFHRVIAGSMIQGGDPTGSGGGGPGFSFKDEFDPSLRFDRAGRLAMANSGPNTNGSQFFISIAPAEPLNDHHTIFGQCDEVSLFIVRAIASVKRDSNDRPITPIVLRKVTIVRPGQALPPLPYNAR